MFLKDTLIENLLFGSSSYERFIFRYKRQYSGKKYGMVKYTIQWWLHNLVVHPIIGIWPSQKTVELHHLSSSWLRNLDLQIEELENIRLPLLKTLKKKIWWKVHNIPIHILIGILPIKPCFLLHDWSAKKMNVKGWV